MRIAPDRAARHGDFDPMADVSDPGLNKTCGFLFFDTIRNHGRLRGIIRTYAAELNRWSAIQIHPEGYLARSDGGVITR